MGSDVGCDDAFEPPCAVSRSVVLEASPHITATPGVSVQRSLDGVVAVWHKRESLVADGGVGDASSDGGEPPNPTPAITSFEVALVDVDRIAVRSRRSIPAPSRLRERRNNLGAIGVVMEGDDTALLHWIETSVTNDGLGRNLFGASLVLGYANADGTVRMLDAKPSMTCERCAMAFAVVSLGVESLVFVRVDHQPLDVIMGATPTKPVFHVLRVRRDGTILEEPAPWLTIDVEVGTEAAVIDAPPISAILDAEGKILVTADRRAWRVDASPRLEEGPWTLPSAPDVKLVARNSNMALGVWSIAPSTEGRGDDDTPREIFGGSFDGSTRAIRSRLTVGRTVLAMDGRGEDVGLLFESAARVFFTTIDSRTGEKRTDDLFVSAEEGVAASQRGFPDIRQDRALIALGDGRFVAVTLGFGQLVARELRCAR